jgi:hypothetical protein
MVLAFEIILLCLLEQSEVCHLVLDFPRTLTGSDAPLFAPSVNVGTSEDGVRLALADGLWVSLGTLHLADDA